MESEIEKTVSSIFLIIEQVSITYMLNFLATYKLIIKRKLIFVFLAPPLHPLSFIISELLINNEHYLLLCSHHMPDIVKQFTPLTSALYTTSFNIITICCDNHFTTANTRFLKILNCPGSHS